MSDLENLAKEAEEASNAASTLEGLAQVQTQFLGKNQNLLKLKSIRNFTMRTEQMLAKK